MLVLVHGTWASDSPRYQSGGSFLSLIQKARPYLYAQPDFFRWSGAYSDGARQQGAVDLQKWVSDRHEEGLDLMGHSHGGNIMSKATEMGLKLGKLVVLSCPLHVDKYFPEFSNLKAPMVSVRVLGTLTMLGAWCLWRPWGWTAPVAVLVRGGDHAVRAFQPPPRCHGGAGSGGCPAGGGVAALGQRFQW